MSEYNGQKTKCAISRQEFRTKAKPGKVTLELDGKVFVFPLEVKEFSTGSFGWQLSDKATPCLDGRDVKCQIGLNVTAIGSKELPKDAAA